MKFKRILKIALLVCCILVAALFNVALIYFVSFEGFSFKNRQFILVAFAFLGISSVVYQIKTLNFYKEQTELYKIKNITLWLLNAGFAGSVIFFSVYLSYDLFQVDWGDQNGYMLPLLLICLPLFLIGVFMLLEEFTLYKQIKTVQLNSKFSNINQITGKMDGDDFGN
ncbi:hypothetical protein PK35_10490 [Tamlana nanhaiensis]|uniref:Uncharacterized protein n=1 Tax=Neotamlana nanhaiensis TaxID=1382798 RepID=A0A0D7W1N5_9FLAO|nr:hypothetical protein [Tamlana nanhaiensis]KJD32618.1 hypothetical protein PK35_10490 [Tamlana nanhaiensis]